MTTSASDASALAAVESTQRAHRGYPDWKKVQRPLIRPSDR
ncbi:hypothetical protein [Mycolicibacterium palauense]|nr:hypothetical protein [Mycolicibacterium palauense]